VIEPFDLGGLGGLDNAVGVAAVETAPAGVDQQGLAGRAHDERGLAALNIYKIDLQGFGGNKRNRKGGGYGENNE
jgi:hypothetical protein